MTVTCPECKSDSVAKKGFRRNMSVKKQKYQCTECKTWFVKNDGFNRMRHKPKIIVRAIHMHQDGMSLSKIQNHLWQHDNVKVSRETLSNWTQKYSVFLKSAKFRSKTNHQRKDTHG